MTPDPHPDHEDAELQQLRQQRIEQLTKQAKEVGGEVHQGAAPAGRGVQPWCDRHAAPLKADPTLNGLLASKLLMDALLSDEPFQMACGRDDAAGKKAEGARINTEAARLGPICCYVGEERVQLVMRLTREARDQAYLNVADAHIAREAGARHPTVVRPPPVRLGDVPEGGGA